MEAKNDLNDLDLWGNDLDLWGSLSPPVEKETSGVVCCDPRRYNYFADPLLIRTL